MYRHVTLEMSFKPFRETDEKYIRQVCQKMFSQWRPLIKDCETVSVMLWPADGSEILDYAGELSDTFEWAYHAGMANCPLNETGDKAQDLHFYRQNYMENPPVMTYEIMKNIVAILKEEGKKAAPDAEILVGDTFDIGPEFAISDFKYNRHNEVCHKTEVETIGLVDCTATLSGDTRRYAAYPDGIPDGTPIGLFLGKQCNEFLRDMDMDFIWLSNGFGFSADPWTATGKVYDGKNFHIEELKIAREKIFAFWKQFRNGCPDYPVRTRGTNYTVGIDYATDAVPIYDIYNGGFNIDVPPNSPWAALDDNFGLEIMGQMTRICELPGDDFLFRYYIHDPWWVNSPWYDRYGGQPTDIYLPMAVSRIDKNGKVQTADRLNILTVDNTFGEMPDACVNEPLPHLLKAKKDAGDEPAPFVLVYPFREYSTTSAPETVAEMYHGDTYICEAINNSLPLNCVVSADYFLKHDLNVYKKSVLISPVPENEEVARKLQEFIKSGGKVVIYGSKNYLKKAEGIDAVKVDIAGSPEVIREALGKCGYEIKFNRYEPEKRTSIMTLARSDGGLFLSLYNQTTVLDMLLKFPLGAPIFIGSDAVMENGFAKYRFGVCEHKECRVFVTQKNGVVSARERSPVNMKYRRKIELMGLNDATVCYFPESYCREDAAVGPHYDYDVNHDIYPDLDDRFKLVYDPIYGPYYRGEHITGNYYLYMPFLEK